MGSKAMTQSPQEGAEGVARFTILSNGQAVPVNVQIYSVTINQAINAIPTAQIIAADGDMASGTFSVSEGNIFPPGAAIKISAGYGDNEDKIFEGIVVKHSISIDDDAQSRLLIECSDKTARMTAGRKNAHYQEQRDSDIMSALITQNGLRAEVDSTGYTHEGLVQHYCSDWDFLLTRAESNGLLVIAKGGTVSVKAPQVADPPTLKVAYGDSLMSFHAEMDARNQWASVQSFAWDFENQAVIEGGPEHPPSLNAQGNINSKTLAGVLDFDTYRLQSAAALSEQELDAWAKAAQIKAGLARVRGRMKFQGSAKAAIGGLIEVDGVGARFNGNVFVSAVKHDIAEGNWFTEVSFGMPPTWHAERADLIAPPAGGLLPGIAGLQIGIVTQLENDPQGEGRVLVTVPMLGANATGVWARLATPYATNNAGMFFMPEIGDEVVLGYFDQNPSYPVIIGCLHSSAKPAPFAGGDDNHIKAFVTRSGAKIEFDDAEKVITVTTPGENKIFLSDKDRSIQLLDQNGNKVILNQSGIFLESPKDIKISAKGSIAIEAVGKIDIASKADLHCAGLNVSSEAQAKLVAKGGASAELSSAGQTVVKGAMVVIN
jgi:Rhs element Vgr protein